MCAVPGAEVAGAVVSEAVPALCAALSAPRPASAEAWARARRVVERITRCPSPVVGPVGPVGPVGGGSPPARPGGRGTAGCSWCPFPFRGGRAPRIGSTRGGPSLRTRWVYRAGDAGVRGTTGPPGPRPPPALGTARKTTDSAAGDRRGSRQGAAVWLHEDTGDRQADAGATVVAAPCGAPAGEALDDVRGRPGVMPSPVSATPITTSPEEPMLAPRTTSPPVELLAHDGPGPDPGGPVERGDAVRGAHQLHRERAPGTALADRP